MDKFTGKVWVLGDDIDTDIIIPTEYLALKTIDDMKQYGFSPLRPELAGQIQKGDIIVAGKNFGCGSSREQAPGVLKALGVKAVIAKSFARIFFRNSINNGLLLIEQPDLHDQKKAVIDGVAEKDPGKGFRDNAGNAERLDDLRCLLSRGAAAEVLSCHDDVALFNLSGQFRAERGNAVLFHIVNCL